MATINLSIIKLKKKMGNNFSGILRILMSLDFF